MELFMGGFQKVAYGRESLNRAKLVEAEIPQEDDVTSPPAYGQENADSPPRYEEQQSYPQTPQAWNPYAPRSPYSGNQTIVVSSSTLNGMQLQAGDQKPSPPAGLWVIFAFSLFSCVCCLWPIGLVALILSSVGVANYRDKPRQGLVLSYIALAFMLVSIAGGIAVIVWLVNYDGFRRLGYYGY